jgi:hypothetical protein
MEPGGCCSRFCFLILVFGSHLFGSAQIDGDAFVLGLLVLDRLAEFLEGRGQGDCQRSGTLAAVVDVSVAFERSRQVAHQGRRSDGHVKNDNHQKHSRVDDILSNYKRLLICYNKKVQQILMSQRYLISKTICLFILRT